MDPDIYYSHWSEAKKSGWRSFELDKVVDPDFRVMKQSLFLIRKIYPKSKVFFLTDKKGLALAKQSNVQVDGILTILDDLPKEYHETWSLGKLKAYNWISKKKRRFIHIDQDVFLAQKLPNHLLDSDIFVQSEDADRRTPKYPYIPYNYNKFMKKIVNFHSIKDHSFEHTYNCGIFGGTNFNLIEKYSSTAMDMVFDKENKNFFLTPSEKQILYYSDKACIAEQYYLAGFCCNQRAEVKLFIDKYNNWLMGHIMDKVIHEYKYVHLVGGLKERSDEYFEKCIDLIDGNKKIWPPVK